MTTKPVRLWFYPPLGIFRVLLLPAALSLLLTLHALHSSERLHADEPPCAPPNNVARSASSDPISEMKRLGKLATAQVDAGEFAKAAATVDLYLEFVRAQGARFESRLPNLTAYRDSYARIDRLAEFQKELVSHAITATYAGHRADQEGRSRDALGHYRLAYRTFSELLGDDDIHICEFGLKTALNDCDDHPDDSEEVVQRILASTEKTQGRSSTFYAGALAGLGTIKAIRGETKAAEEHLSAAAKLFEPLTGEDSAFWKAQALVHLSLALQSNRNYLESERRALQALRMIERTVPDNIPLRMRAHIAHFLVLKAQERDAEAVESFETALPLLTSPPFTSATVATYIDAFASTLERLGRAEEAGKYRATIERLRR